MNKEQAETIALQALSFLIKDEVRLAHFLKNTGLSPMELRKHVEEPELLGGVLDAILSDDSLLLDFCNASFLSPETIVQARRALPGGYNIE